MEANITRFTKLSAYSLAATGLIGIGAVFLGHAAFAKEMDNLQVTPRPQGVTELYFTNYRRLPASLKAGGTQQVSFTVHNLQHQTTTYHYRIVAKPTEGTVHPLSQGTFALLNNQSQATQQTIIIPKIPGRMAIEVDVDYIAPPFGSSTPSAQKQSIRYWVDIIKPGAHS